jgi:hypothetical protein
VSCCSASALRLQVGPQGRPPEPKSYKDVLRQQLPLQDEPERSNPGNKEQKPAGSGEPIKKPVPPQATTPVSKPRPLRVNPQASAAVKPKVGPIGEKVDEPLVIPEAAGPSNGGTGTTDGPPSASAGTAAIDASPRVPNRDLQALPKEASTPNSKSNTPRFREVRKFDGTIFLMVKSKIIVALDDFEAIGLTRAFRCGRLLHQVNQHGTNPR